ncbi:MAG TPA: glycosyltransferase [Gemmatimonadales bacterium]
MPRNAGAPANVDVLHIIAPAPFGGAERVVRDLCLSQRDAGYNVAAIVLGEVDRERTWLERSLESAGFPFETIRKRASAYLAVSRAIRRRLRTMRPSVVHTHAYKADVLTRLALPPGPRHVITAHGFTTGDRKNRLYEWLDRQVMKRADAVIAVSTPLAELLAGYGVPAAKLHCVSNAAIAPAPLPRKVARSALGLDDDSTVVGWIGRMSFEKGPDLFVEALRQAWLEGMQGILIGSGPMDESVAQQIAAIRTGPDIRLAGALEDAGRYLSAFDILVLSSRTEGSPIVVAEALQVGVPIVAPAIGDLPRLAQQLDSIQLARPGDSADLAAALVRVEKDLPVYTQRAARARADALQLLGPAAWVERIEQVYESVLSSGAIDILGG